MKIKNSNMEHMHRHDHQFHEFFVKLFFKIALQFTEKKDLPQSLYILII